MILAVEILQVYVLWLHLIFVSLIPLSVLFCLNKAIHKKLTNPFVSVRRTGHRSLRRRELRLARVSLGIVLLYMICHLPKLVPTLCEIAHKNAKVIFNIAIELSGIFVLLDNSWHG